MTDFRNRPVRIEGRRVELNCDRQEGWYIVWSPRHDSLGERARRGEWGILARSSPAENDRRRRVKP